MSVNMKCEVYFHMNEFMIFEIYLPAITLKFSSGLVKKGNMISYSLIKMLCSSSIIRVSCLINILLSIRLDTFPEKP